MHVRPSYHISAHLRRRADVLTFGAGLDHDRLTAADDLTDAGRRRTLRRETDAGTQGTQAEASPRADLGGGWGAAPIR